MKATNKEADLSSMQGTILVDLGRLFATNAPSKTPYNVSLSAEGSIICPKSLVPKASWPNLAPSTPT
jgi:hypothetical protein